MNYDSIDVRIKNLEHEKCEIESKQIINEDIKNDLFNGYFSSFTDNFEELFDIKNMKNLNFSDANFEEKLKMENLTKSKSVGKIVQEPGYILCKIDKKIFDKLKIDANYLIKVEALSDISTYCKLIKIISNEDNSEFYAIFSMDMIPKNFLNLRKANFKIVFKKFTGAKINRKCIYKVKFSPNDDFLSDVVFVKHLKSFLMKKVEIITENDDFCICKYEDSSDIDNKKIQNGDQVLLKNPHKKFLS